MPKVPPHLFDRFSMAGEYAPTILVQGGQNGTAVVNTVVAGTLRSARQTATAVMVFSAVLAKNPGPPEKTFYILYL